MTQKKAGGGTPQMTAAEFQKYYQQKKAGQASKFGAVPVPAVIGDGVRYRSTLEYKHHNKLRTLQLHGEVANIERELPFPLEVNGVFLCNYVLDFRVTYADGRVEHVDCKSKPTLTALYKLKKGLMLALHGIELIEVYDEE